MLCKPWLRFNWHPRCNVLVGVLRMAQLEVPEGLPDDVAAQYYVNPATVVGMVDVSKVPKVGPQQSR